MVCKKCGCCCVDFSVCGVGFHNKEEFLNKFPFLEYSGIQGLEIDRPRPTFRCTRLVSKGDGTRVCSDYKNRPEFCRNHPKTERTRSIGCTAPITVSFTAKV